MEENLGWSYKMKKKVYFLINNLQRAGGERVIIELARQIAMKRQVKIITLMDSVEYACHVPHLSLSKTRSGAGMYLRYWSYVHKLRKILLSEKPDILISFFELSNFINIEATRGTGVKSVVSVRATPSEVYLHGIYAMVMSRGIRTKYPLADLIIPNSRVTLDDLEKNYGISRKKMRVIYNTVNIKEVRDAAKKPLEKKFSQIYAGFPVLINSGRLTEQKAQFHLVKIFSEIKKELPRAHLIILGSGQLMEKIKSKAEQLGVADSVFLIGNQPNPFNFISRSDAFLFPSFFEGFPNALVEAMACGIPIIASNCKSEPREILAPDTKTSQQARDVELAKYGILVPLLKRGFYDEISPEEKIFTSSVLKLIRNGELRKKYSRLGMQRVRDFESGKITREFISMIESKVLKQD